MGHRYGDSPQLSGAVVKLDNQAGKILDAIHYREAKYKEKWMILLTTDNGRDKSKGRNHGGQSARERLTWIVSNVKFNNYAKLDHPAIVDIMPTMASYLNIKIQGNTAKEIDGISLIGNISVAQPEVNIFENKLDITWQTLDTTGSANIWISTTNNSKTGGKYDFIFLRKVPVSEKHATIDIEQYPSNFYKIVIEAKYNIVNKWCLKTSVR